MPSKEADWKRVEAEIPTNWLDPLLTGPDSVFGSKRPGTWGCPEIEALLNGVRGRLRALQRSRKAGKGKP